MPFGYSLKPLDPNVSATDIDAYIASAVRDLFKLGRDKYTVRHRSDPDTDAHFSELIEHPVEGWPLIRIHHPLSCGCHTAPHVAALSGQGAV